MSFDWGSALMCFCYVALFAPASMLYWRLMVRRNAVSNQAIAWAWAVVVLLIGLLMLGTANSDTRLDEADNMGYMWFLTIWFSLLGAFSMAMVMALRKLRTINR